LSDDPFRPKKRPIPAKTPADRNTLLEKQRLSVRRHYKTTPTKRYYSPSEERHLTEMVSILKIAGYTQAQIGAVVGLSLDQVKEIVAQPHVQELIRDLQEQLPKAAYSLLQSYSIEAVQVIVDVMRSAKEDKYVLQAASEILDRSGLPKMSRSEAVVHKTEEQKTTFTDDGITDALRQASPEVQEQAAQLIEQMEQLLAKQDAS